MSSEKYTYYWGVCEYKLEPVDLTHNAHTLRYAPIHHKGALTTHDSRNNHVIFPLESHSHEEVLYILSLMSVLCPVVLCREMAGIVEIIDAEVGECVRSEIIGTKYSKKTANSTFQTL